MNSKLCETYAAGSLIWEAKGEFFLAFLKGSPRSDNKVWKPKGGIGLAPSRPVITPILNSWDDISDLNMFLVDFGEFISVWTLSGDALDLASSYSYNVLYY